MSIQELDSREATIYPVYYIGSVGIFYAVSQMHFDERSALTRECCYMVGSAAGLNLRSPENLNCSTNIKNYICDHVELYCGPEKMNEIANISITRNGISLFDNELRILFCHQTDRISCVSSFNTDDLGFVCYIHKDNGNNRKAFVYCTTTNQLEQQICTTITNTFLLNINFVHCTMNGHESIRQQQSRSNMINSHQTAHNNDNIDYQDVSFVSANDNYSGIARIHRPNDIDHHAFHTLNFLRPSSNPNNSTLSSSNDIIQPISRSFSLNNKIKKQFIDGIECVPNSMLYFERWFHGDKMLYSADCFRNAGDFYVFKHYQYYVLNVLTSDMKVANIILQDELVDRSSFTCQNHDYYSVSHFINYHMLRGTTFQYTGSSYFELKNPILRAVEDRYFRQ